MLNFLILEQFDSRLEPDGKQQIKTELLAIRNSSAVRLQLEIAMHRFLSLLIFVSISLLSNPGQGEEGRPNVLFITVDDLRPELGCFGAKHIYVPTSIVWQPVGDSSKVLTVNRLSAIRRVQA